MPHHQHFKKALKKNEQSRIRNRAAKSRVATFIKKVRTAQSKEEAEQALVKACSVIDKTAQKGILKKETASRKKSRLAKFVGKMQ